MLNVSKLEKTTTSVNPKGRARTIGENAVDSNREIKLMFWKNKHRSGNPLIDWCPEITDA